MRSKRSPAFILLILIAGLPATAALLSCGRAERSTEAEHGRMSPPEIALDPAALLRRLGDPAAVARVSRVSLRGQLDALGPAPRRPVEERASWPVGWERRSTDAGLAFQIRLDGGFLKTTPERRGGGPAYFASAARMRRRALFVLRFLAEGVASGERLETVELGRERLQALRVKDADGEFRLLLGGIAGGLRGIEDGDEAVLFQAFSAFEKGFYPSVQSALREGRLLEVLRVTHVEAD